MLRTQTIPVSKAKNYTKDITDDNGTVIVENGRSVTYPLDPSFYMYVRSVSNVSSTYSYKNNGDNVPIRVIPNELVSQSDIWRLLETPHNSLRILRYPAAAIGPYEEFMTDKEPLYTVTGNRVNPPFIPNKKYTAEEICNRLLLYNSDLDLSMYLPEEGEWPIHTGETYIFTLEDNQYTLTVSKDAKPVYKEFPTLNVIYDQYTNPEGIKIVYYAQPQHFDIMTSTRCELPMDAFDDIVTGAVDLYVQYVAGAEANKRRIQEAQRQQAKENDRIRNNNEDED